MHSVMAAINPHRAIELDDVLSLSLKGGAYQRPCCKDREDFTVQLMKNSSRDVMRTHKDEAGEQPVDYLYKTMAETLSSADYIFKQSQMHPTKSVYPSTGLGNSLKTIALR